LSVALIKGRLGKRLGEELALTLAGTNRCEYCASAHSTTAKIAGLDEADVVAALQGESGDVREAAALRFATAVVEKRGRIDDADFKAVIDAGFTPGEVAENCGACSGQYFHELLQQCRENRDRFSLG
jgi:AhpD family alkylhydroperoxidase